MLFLDMIKRILGSKDLPSSALRLVCAFLASFLAQWIDVEILSRTSVADWPRWYISTGYVGMFLLGLIGPLLSGASVGILLAFIFRVQTMHIAYVATFFVLLLSAIAHVQVPSPSLSYALQSIVYSFVLAGGIILGSKAISKYLIERGHR